ncbi:MAG: carbohydrate kinase [Hydrococcus sp. C42_A2020_068]|uniref:carbohydrate kinase family protein n=1 Tax=Pleurocapsa sp. PCC 7327 TaxID=118163 RepID=UPI00029F979E|nr:carbohydrate kinase [Pleurocapsa sp. PCC 7327]AFY75510.1 sugar kinase, ribokinase [Pleurocapsa sp. PCC 7327]MBF2022003.1 carbohydrate kinase [Hydrococcus sp. C42_A2020_068]
MISSRVLCLGEILFDCLADQPGRELERVESWTPYPGGAPANVACGLVKLGTTAGFIGCVGRDKAGDDLVALLESTGVDTTGVQRHPTAPTRQVYVTRSQAGERHFAGFGDIATTEFADTRLAADRLPEALFAGADYLVMGTLELAYPESRQAIYRALELAKQHQVKVFVDINWRPVFWLDVEAAPSLIWEVVKQADLIKCSDDEAQWLFETENPKEIAQRVETVKGVLVTAGERGCSYSLGNSSGTLPVFKVNVIDTTGAGDGFVAGFLHRCCQQGEQIFQNPEMAKEAVTYASAVGALTTTKPGAIAAQPTAAEVEEFLSQQ